MKELFGKICTRKLNVPGITDAKEANCHRLTHVYIIKIC